MGQMVRTALAASVAMMGLGASLGWVEMASAQDKTAGERKQLSEHSVITLMNYAWTILPAKFTAPDRKTIEVDKSKRDAMIDVASAWDIIKAGNLSAQAQLCDMWEAQAANFKARMAREQATKKWSEQQLLYISTLHRMTIHMAAGKMRVVDKPNDESQIFLEPIEPSKDSCTADKRQKIEESIVTYVKASPLNLLSEPPPETTASVPAAAAQPVPASAKDQKK